MAFGTNTEVAFCLFSVLAQLLFFPHQEDKVETQPQQTQISSL